MHYCNCFCYINTSKKLDMLTVTTTSSKSSIELHVSYFKRHSLSKSLHSRRWLKTRRRSIINISGSKVISCCWLSYSVGDPEHSKNRFLDSMYRVFLRNAEIVYSDTNTLPQAAQSYCLAHMICRPCERSLNTAIQEAKHNEFCVRRFTQTLCKTIAMSVA